MPFFKVIYAAGAYLDDFFYQEGEIVEYHPTDDEIEKAKKGEALLWGVEVDAAGNELDESERTIKTGENLPGQRLAQTTGKETRKVTPPAKKDAGNGEPSKAEKKAQIKEALTLLDGNDDAVWTAGGEPKVDAVSNFLGYPVTSDEIEEASPGFKRPAK